MSYPPSSPPVGGPSYHPVEADAGDEALHAAPWQRTLRSSGDIYSARAGPSSPTLDEPFSPPAHASSLPHEGDAMLTYSSGPRHLALGSPTTPTYVPSDPYAAYGPRSPPMLTRDASSMNMSFMSRGTDLTASGSTHGLAASHNGLAGGFNEKPRAYPNGRQGFWARQSRFRKFLLIGLAILLIVIAVAVAVPLAMNAKKSDNNVNTSQNAAAAEGSTTGSAARSGTTLATGAQSAASSAAPTVAPVPVVPTTGGDGSVVTTEDGSTFIYNNTFGGYWNSIPFNNSARAQADVPALSEPWDYENNLIQGVNLGGWLVIEPFIVPSLFEEFNPNGGINFDATVVDEWTLCEALGNRVATVIENHYATFITEKDFAEIAAAGLNWIRLPVGFWMIETYGDEPFLAQVSWKYFLKALTWARKYGLRINLDLHAVPGSQNGYNHSSKLGSLNFLAGIMGLANGQRALNYIRTLTQFISQPEYKDLVPMFSILNEPLAAVMSIDTLRAFYLEAYNMIRNDITGFGEGKGPFVVLHDGFTAQSTPVAEGGWNGYLTGADRLAMDSHPYLCFSAPNNEALPYQASKPCSYWGPSTNRSTNGFGLSISGEWSLAVNDCGKWLNNVGNGQRFEGSYYPPGQRTASFEGVGSCDTWNAYDQYSSSMKAGLQQVAQGHQDAFRHWFFWTWKTGYSPALGKVANPLWNYQLGLQYGYIPANPRLSRGSCARIVAAQNVNVDNLPAQPLQPWMTGGAGAGTIQPAQQLRSWAWPPASIGTTPVANLPTYTATGAIVTMPPPTSVVYPAGVPTVTQGNGWAQPTDTEGWNVPVAGCSYPDPWNGVEAAMPNRPCTGSRARAMEKAKRAAVPLPGPTSPPVPRNL